MMIRDDHIITSIYKLRAEKTRASQSFIRLVSSHDGIFQNMQSFCLASRLWLMSYTGPQPYGLQHCQLNSTNTNMFMPTHIPSFISFILHALIIHLGTSPKQTRPASRSPIRSSCSVSGGANDRIVHQMMRRPAPTKTHLTTSDVYMPSIFYLINGKMKLPWPESTSPSSSPITVQTGKSKSILI
ncbi:hypothetical protein LI328DRAFT_160825 [Trichoderma asperelloides]|nr:hypothetical protein LI328DRAFT_160825 [Trichoderma asperelloides]